MRFGFAKNDITPPLGVELCGFGPFIMRRSIGVRDRLWARAMAVEGDNGEKAVLITCDLVGMTADITSAVRALLRTGADLVPEQVMIAASHTHSGPSIGAFSGWGEAYPPYLHMLPNCIAEAARRALSDMEEGVLAEARVPCEGIGLNREYDRDAPPLAEVLDDSWRPAKPELTDTAAHVFTVRNTAGMLKGFVSAFGCHPVVCCQETRFIHGDYPGVATNWIEREHPGSVGLFLQGAEGDVNSCVVHKPETESLLALDVIAGRYARAVRQGIADARTVRDGTVRGIRREVVFTRKSWDRAFLEAKQKEFADIVTRHATVPSYAEHRHEANINSVYLCGIRKMLARLDAGLPLARPFEIAGLRLGTIGILGSPFETFQAIKNETLQGIRAPVPFVASFVNDTVGYAPDHTAAARGGYAADMVPFITGEAPFLDAHSELVAAHRETDRLLFS